MTEKKHTIVGLGELLWDLLPSGRQLGGAPANFAYITNLLGDVGVTASRVGSDALGEEAVERLKTLGLATDWVQRDANHPTGSVNVEIDPAGQARFEILENVAWDFLEFSPAWQELAQTADAVCFGSLAQRSPASRSSIRSFLRATRPQVVRVFDVNLRQHFFTAQILSESMHIASIVKLNHEELPRIMHLLELAHHNEKASAHSLLSSHNLNLVCITRGNNGSLLASSDEVSEHPGFQVKVADTVGAGDAFTAALVHGYLRQLPLSQINEQSNRVGAWVSSQTGATPTPKAEGLPHTLAEIA